VGVICSASVGNIDETVTILHWAMPATASAASKALRLDVELTALPLVTKNFLGRNRLFLTIWT